jgi:hypothetical protein
LISLLKAKIPTCRGKKTNNCQLQKSGHDLAEPRLRFGNHKKSSGITLFAASVLRAMPKHLFIEIKYVKK